MANMFVFLHSLEVSNLIIILSFMLPDAIT